MKKFIITLVLGLVMLSSSVGIRTDSSVQLSPLIKTNPLKTSFNHYILVKDGDCDTFSTLKRPNSFPLNSRIIDTDFNILKQTPYLDGLYFFDGQNFAERFYFPTFSAPSSPSSLLTVDGQHYYIPGGWDTYPLENICSYRSGKKVEFCRLDTGEMFATFDFAETKNPPYLLENGKLAVMFDKTNIKLLDLTNQKVLYQTKSIQNWDAGNGVFATSSAIFNYRTGESFDLSNLGLDIIFTHILIKKDYVEFYVDVDRNSKMSDNPRIVRVGFDGRIIETIQMSFLQKGQDFRILQSKGDIVLVNLWKLQYGTEASISAYSLSTGQMLWEQAFGNNLDTYDEVFISNEKEPKVILHVCHQLVKLDLNSGNIEKSINWIYQQVYDPRLAFIKGDLVYAMQESTNCVFDKYSIEKMDSQGNKAPVEIPFQVHEALIDSFEDKVYLVSRKMMADMSALIVDTAIIDPKTGVATKSISFVAEGVDAKAVTLDGKFLFVFGAIKQTVYDLSTGKKAVLDDTKSSPCGSISSKVAGDKIYVLANFADKKDVLTVFDTNLVQLSKTWGLGDAAKILFANDKYVIFGKSSPEGMVVSDCNGNWWDSSSSCVMLDGDFAVIKKNGTANDFFRLNLETRQVEVLGQKNVWSYPITTSLGNTFFGGRNTYDRDLNWLQTDMYISRIFPSTDKIYAQPSYFFGSVVELKPAPCYTLKRVSNNSFTIQNSRGDELADSLYGCAYAFTTPNNTIDRPTKLEGVQRFENLKPEQSATLKFDLG
ncbi:MAG: hypothetical protein KA140_01900 [Caldisericia bacterium]|nr:hypothetical protein [Caldisericia bacterium]